MIRIESQFRVRYAETDQMGFVYYANYAVYFEVGRTDLIRSVGLPYAMLEEEHNLLLPVISLHIDYKQPARYDELITLKTMMREKPTVKIGFDYELHNEKNELLVTGKVVLAFVRKDTGMPCRPPRLLMEAIEKKWER